MNKLLEKIRWAPHVDFDLPKKSVVEGDSSPWLALSEIIPGLYLTCEEALCDRRSAQKECIAVILALNGEEHVSPYRVYEYSENHNRCIYKKIPTFLEFVTQLDEYTSVEMPNIERRKVFIRSITAEDNPSYDVSQWFPETCLLIELIMVNRRCLQEKVNTGENVELSLPAVGAHCLVGVSRSAAVVTAYLMKRCGFTKDAALSFIKLARPVVNPNCGFQNQLIQWEKSEYYRVVDPFTASLAAFEFKECGNFEDCFPGQLLRSLQFSKLSSEREFFGLVASEVITDESLMLNCYTKLSDVFKVLIRDELFDDVPAFFDNLCEVVKSLIRYIPTMLICGSESFELEKCFDDAIYYSVVKELGVVGVCKDAADVIRSYCSLLEAIGTKHLSMNLQNRPRLINCEGETLEEAPEGMCLTFPFLPFLAYYAMGFIQNVELDSVSEGSSMCNRVESTVSTVMATFKENFLLTASGTEMSSDNSLIGRWHANSRFSYLKTDVEIQIMESVERGCTLTEATRPFLSLNHSDVFVSLLMVRKIAGAALGIRFFYDAIDQYMEDEYGDLFAECAFYGTADKIASCEEVLTVIQSASRAYMNKYGHTLDLIGWFEKELQAFNSESISFFVEKLKSLAS